MQCPSCQFENMPGIVNCGRCGASLTLACTEINVNPPRASKAQKQWRAIFPSVGLALNRISQFFSSGWDFLFGRDTALGQSIDFGSFNIRLLVPGWPQFAIGQLGRGRMFFLFYIVCLLCGMIWLGTQTGNLFIGLAIGCHTASVLDIILKSQGELSTRLQTTLFILGCILFLLYLPMYWVGRSVASPQIVQQNLQPFQSGDVLLLNRWVSHQPGDIVQYDIPTLRVNQLGNRILLIEGTRIDRIIARPGQRVTVQGGQLLVDGVVSQWLPYNPNRIPAQLELTVPSSSFFILPSTDPNLPLNSMVKASLVPESSIEGVVYWRSQPFSRFGPIR